MEKFLSLGGLPRDDLRARAQSLGVTTRVGKKWKTAAELRRACKRMAQSQQSLGAYFRRPQAAQAPGHAAASAPGPDCAGGGAQAAQPPVGVVTSAPTSGSASAGRAAQPARAGGWSRRKPTWTRSMQSRGRNKERRAKRYAADPVYRQKKKAQNKAWRAKRYAEGPVFRPRLGFRGMFLARRSRGQRPWSHNSRWR